MSTLPTCNSSLAGFAGSSGAARQVPAMGTTGLNPFLSHVFYFETFVLVRLMLGLNVRRSQTGLARRQTVPTVPGSD